MKVDHYLKRAATRENRIFAYAKTKAQISFAVTAKLISAFVFATRIVHFLFFLYPKFQASNHLLRLFSPVCVGPGRKSRRPVFSRRGSNMITKMLGTISVIFNIIPVHTKTDLFHEQIRIFGYAKTKAQISSSAPLFSIIR